MEKPENKKIASPQKEKPALSDVDAAARKKTAFYKKRSFKYGSMATAFTVVFIAVVVLLNVILSVVVTKYPMSADLTSTKRYKLTTQTTSYLKNLKQNIKIYVLANESQFKSDSSGTLVYTSLTQYPQYSSKVSLSFVDLNKNPAFASNYSSESFSAGDILVTNGTKYKKISLSDCFTTTTDSSGNTSITGNQTEQTIDSAIFYVTATSTPTVVFTSGHNESSDYTSSLQTLLTKNNYTSKTQDIATGDIDSNASAVVIVDPQVDFTQAELTKIDNFLTNKDQLGKNLFVFFDPQEATLPNLENFVKAWGIQVEKGVIYDDSGYDTLIPKITDYDGTTFPDILSSVGTAFVDTRKLTLLFDSRDARTTTSLLKTPDTSRLWNTTDFSKGLTKSDSDEKGPFTVMALGTKTRTSGSNTLTSNVVVSGSTAFLNSQYLQSTSINNGNVVVTAFNKITGTKAAFAIVPKDVQSQTLSVTQPQFTFFLILLVVIVPIAFLVFGLVVYFRRRHL